MTEAAKIKPCPFCGGSDIRFDRHNGAGRGPFHHGETVYSMCCYECGATFPNRYRKELLVEAWNRRATIACALEKHTPQADARAFNRWFSQTMANADGRFDHLPRWLKSDLREAWIAALAAARTALAQADCKHRNPS